MTRILKLENTNRQSIPKMIAVSVVTSIMTVLLLLAYVLPAFYGVDPMGWGAKLGSIGTKTATLAVNNNALTLAQPNTQIVTQSNAAPLATVPQADDPLAIRQDTVDLVIPPKQSLDYRLAMERDYDLDYHWSANGKTVYTELRGEPKDGKAPSKTFATLKNSSTGKGFFIIPFNGQFGWHWQNKTDQPVTIRLHTKGTYQIVGQVSTQTQK